MKIIACYDNGGKTVDRYTVVFNTKHDVQGKYNECLGLSSNPSDPQGFSQFSGCTLGRHLGKKVAFKDLPENIQKHVEVRIA
jgi:hypothetical protein